MRGVRVERVVLVGVRRIGLSNLMFEDIRAFWRFIAGRIDELEVLEVLD